MNKQLQKLIDLSNKTGDRLIVFDPRNEDSAYVVMVVEDYEKMAIGRSEVRGLTEDELLDKINRDIAIWKSDKIDENEAVKLKDFLGDEPEGSDQGVEEDNWFSMEELTEKTDYYGNSEPFKKSKAWKIPSERKERAEEIIEEDRYYLENLED